MSFCYNTGMTFGRHLRAKRIEQSWTLREFAKARGLDAGNLSRVERSIVLPSARLCRKLLQLYGFRFLTAEWYEAVEAYLEELSEMARCALT